MHISTYIHLPSRVEKKRGEPRNQREELLNIFLATLNKSREEGGYKPYTYSRLALMVKGMTDQDLYILLKECQNFVNFGALFHTKVKQWHEKKKEKAIALNQNDAQQVRRTTYTPHQEEVPSLSPQLG